MPQRDNSHDVVKQALIKDGWSVTDDPYIIPFSDTFFFVDLGASEAKRLSLPETQIIGLQHGVNKIAVEIKDFRKKSVAADLEHSIGQYVLYKLLLQQHDPLRDIYLAVTNEVYKKVFERPLGQFVIANLPLKLIVVDATATEVIECIPERPIARL